MGSFYSVSRIHWKVASSQLLRVYERLIESGLSSFASACRPARAGRQMGATYRARRSSARRRNRQAAHPGHDSGPVHLRQSCGSAGFEPAPPGCRQCRHMVLSLCRATGDGVRVGGGGGGDVGWASGAAAVPAARNGESESGERRAAEWPNAGEREAADQTETETPLSILLALTTQ